MQQDARLVRPHYDADGIAGMRHGSHEDSPLSMLALSRDLVVFKKWVSLARGLAALLPAARAQDIMVSDSHPDLLELQRKHRTIDRRRGHR